MPIKRHSSLHLLSHDHHHGLILAQLIKKGSPAYKNLPDTTEGKVNYTISFYNDSLVQHFNDEEEILFPVVKGKSESLDSFISEIIDEHHRMEQLVGELKTGKNTEDLLNELGEVLEKHIRKEERELFNKIEELLSEEELTQIGERIKVIRDRGK